jgi:hypothetical protein
MGRLDTSNLPMQEMIDYLLTHQDEAGKMPGNTHDPSKHTIGEDIHIPDTVECFQDLMDEIDVGMENFSKGQLEIENIWGQVQNKGQCTAYHCHTDPYRQPTGKDLSFVFYLQANGDCGYLKFPIDIHGVDYGKTIVPNTGGLIVFPAHLPHFTLKNDSDIPRVVVSGNYREKGFIKFRESRTNETE